MGVVSQEGKGSTFFFELPLFEMPSLDTKGAFEESNIDDVMKISRTNTETEANHPLEVPLALEDGDVETGPRLQKHSIEVDNSFNSTEKATSFWLWLLGWRWSLLLKRRSSTVYSSSPLEPSTPTNNGPHELNRMGFTPEIRTGSTGVSVTAGTSGSPFAPHGLQIAVGSSTERRRKLLMNRYDGGELTAGPFIADFKIDEEESDDGDRNSVDKGDRSSIRSSFTKRCFRFMIVDDTIATRKLMRRMLSSAGHHVDDAIDG